MGVLNPRQRPTSLRVIAHLLGLLSTSSCAPNVDSTTGTRADTGGVNSSSIGSDSGSDADTASIDIDSCPTQQEPTGTKLAPLVEGALAPDTVVSAIVHLRPISGSPSSQNSASDEAVPNRAELNQQQVRCVLEAFGIEGARPLARWYEPITAIGADNLPIGLAFAANVRWSALENVAKHPYVAQITLDFGESVRLGQTVQQPAFDCPDPGNESPSKVDVAQPATPTDRLPVVVELNVDHLPIARACDADLDVCDEAVASVWERIVAGTRTLTCVKDWLNAKLESFPDAVPYAAQEAWPLFPNIPPFGQIPVMTTAFGVALNWNEIMAASRHPYVKSVWSSSALSVGPLPEGCPPAYEDVSQLSCDRPAEPFDSKLTADAIELWSSEPTKPFDVLIAVRKNYTVCPQPACPGTARQCPERDKYDAWLERASEASQMCVKGLIEEVGGSVSEFFTLGNGLSATLTWEQIQIVAAHPDVGSIASDEPAPPP